MNTFAFVALALALVVAVSAQSQEALPHNDFYTETGNCIANQTFYDKCNRCSCSANGRDAACTMMACQTPENPRIDGFSTTRGLTCLPGKKFTDGCNECECGATGHVAKCTLAAVCNADATKSKPTKIIPHIDNFDESQECTPGQSFKYQCNTCRCSADGKRAACTSMACAPSDKIRIDNYEQGVKCPAGKMFYDKCNSCKCGNDGVSAACTLMNC